MAFEIFKEIAGVHEDVVCCITYDRAKKTVYTAAEGDKAVKVGFLWCSLVLCTQIDSKQASKHKGGSDGGDGGHTPASRCGSDLHCGDAASATPTRAPHAPATPTGMGPQVRSAAAHAGSAPWHGDICGVRFRRTPLVLCLHRRRDRRVGRQGDAAAGGA
jgi:hypothetical protein